ncbi:MAG: insulinase family protein [Faecalibacterium sp.]
MERTCIAPGVHLSTAPADKFNRCRISIHFLFPAARETATAHALLPLVMERGYADCPDMTELTKKLARLYGADMSIYARSQGANRNICIGVTGIKDSFALAGEALCQEYAQMALGVAFRPYLVDGVFDDEAVAIEKRMLQKSLEDEINDKRLYCARGAQRTFYKDTPAGIRQEGYVEEVAGLSPADVTAAYQQMLRTASIELVVLGYGAQTETVKEMLLAALAKVDRAPVAPIAPFFMQPMPTCHLSETFDIVQAKLCMAFTAGQAIDRNQIERYRMAMAIFGGSVSSRLFLNVREKMHLCYYCSCSFNSATGAMMVHSGVEPSNAAIAEQAILKELAELCTGPITDEEFEDCRRGLVSGTNSVEDTLAGIESWYYMEIMRGGAVHTPAEARAALLAVTKEQVQEILAQFSLSVSYLVTKAEEGTDA